jgi:hypothetical protein
MDTPPTPPQLKTSADTPPYTAEPDDLIDESKGLAVGLAQLGGAVIGLSGVAFALGWLHWYCYLLDFHAEWLIAYVPTRSLLVSSVFPLVSVVAWSTALIARRVSPETAPRFWGRLGRVLYVVPLALVIRVVAELRFPEALPWATRLLALYFAAMAGDSVAHMVAVLAVRGAPRGRLFRWAVADAVFATLLLFYIPLYTSDGDSRRDRNARHTSLPRLTVVQSVVPSDGPEYVLVAGDSSVFTVPLPLPAPPVPVRCYPLTSVREVRLP